MTGTAVWRDPPLLRPTLERLGRFGADLPDRSRVHLDAGYDSTKTRDLLAEVGCEAHIATKGIPAPIQNTARWVVERTNSWHNRGFRNSTNCRLRCLLAAGGHRPYRIRQTNHAYAKGP